MKLKTEQGQLTLPSDFSFEIEQNSAFFSDNGATSLAATIPATPADQAKLGWPTRLGRSTRFVNSYPAAIEHGAFHKKGTLMVTSATDRSITCSMALEDSDLYARHKSDNLKDLFADAVRTDYSTAADWYAWLFQVYTGAVESEFRLFPVALDKNEDAYVLNNKPTGSGAGVLELEHSARVIMQGDDRVSVPDGFGIAPFLKLGWFIEKVITLCGYSVQNNCFTTDSRLGQLVLIHNCSDAICDGTIHYADLVPDVTVGDLIGWLCDKFNIQFSVNPSVGTADIVQMESVLQGGTDMDITSKVIGRKAYAYSPSSRVILKSDTSLEGAAPAMETMEELKAKWGSLSELDEATWNDRYQTPNGLVLRKSTGEYYVIKEFIREGWDIPDKTKERLGSNYFTYDRRNSDQSEAKDAIDVLPPMTWCDGFLCPYIGDQIYRRTTINNEEERGKQSIIVCEYAGIASTGKYYYGTTQQYSDTGASRSNAITWNAPGIFRQLWPLYNKMLLNHKVEVSCRLDLQQMELLQYNLYALKNLDGQKMIPSYIRYEVGRLIRCLETRFFLVKDYTDEVDDEDTIIPSPLYKWRFNDDDIQAWVHEMTFHGVSDGQFDYSYEPDDPFVNMDPTYLPPPTELGQTTMRKTRHIKWWYTDWLQPSRIVDQGWEYMDAWYESVNI